MTTCCQRLEVEWADLSGLSRGERASEYLRPLLLLGTEIFAWSNDSLLLGALAAFYFFLAALRLAHDTFHRNLGVAPWVNRLCLWLLSAAMLGSLHAVQRTHLLHHRHCLSEQDIEAAHVGGSARNALLYGPLFPIRLHRAAWRSNVRNERRQIALELAFNAVILLCALSSAAPQALKLHVAAMLVANCLTAFFAVWTVHHDCEAPGMARTLRRRGKSKLVLDMFYHQEHHLFPRVPTARLATLAQRLDDAHPSAPRKMVY
jgi:fatty acid desaturase